MSTHPNSFFVTGLTAALVTDDARWNMRGRNLAIHSGGETEKIRLETASEVLETLTDRFGSRKSVKPLHAAGPEGDGTIRLANQCLSAIKGLQAGFEVRSRRRPILKFERHLTDMSLSGFP